MSSLPRRFVFFRHRVIYAPAAFLGSGSHFSGSLSGIKPSSPVTRQLHGWPLSNHQHDRSIISLVHRSINFLNDSLFIKLQLYSIHSIYNKICISVEKIQSSFHSLSFFIASNPYPIYSQDKNFIKSI